VAEPIRLAGTPVSLPLVEPFVISRGLEEAYETVEVTLTWGGGTTGHGEATPIEYFGETTETVLAYLEQVQPLLGADPFALETIDEALDEVPGNRAARAGIDAALHDLIGRVLDVPVWRLLGLTPAGPATVVTVSLLDPDAMARSAERHTALGRGQLKLKLGGRDGLDLDRVKAVRAASPARLTVDVNEYWDLAEALELIPQLADLGVELVEQPLVAGSPDGPTLKARSTVPIVVDEDCHTLADVAACVELAHGINIKLAKSGGLREAVRMVHAARALDLMVMLGCMGESGLGLAPACAISSLVDHTDLDGNLGLVRDPWDGVTYREGRQVASDRPGLGMTRR
jgi:L-alanine-DL-glutamate epimerase-like enolase superfamily enzyme